MADQPPGLVGRDEEPERIERSLERARPALLLLEGEAERSGTPTATTINGGSNFPILRVLDRRLRKPTRCPRLPQADEHRHAPATGPSGRKHPLEHLQLAPHER